MAKKNKYIKKKPYNYHIQIDAMRKKFSSFSVKKNGRKDFIFTGNVIVKPELPTYKISINYRGNARPIVKVISPSLKKGAPHTYKDDSLCLYHPDDFKWKEDRLITKEIMQWTTAWLYFYEYWLQEGLWIGPEALHGERATNKDNEQEDE